MPGTREYVSLPARLRQASQARADMRERLQGSRSRTVTITDQQLADADWEFARRTATPPTYTRDDWTPVSAEWIYDIGRVYTDITTAVGTAAMTINTAMNRFIPTGAMTGTMGVYNPITYTTTWTVSEQDQAYWTGWNTAYTETVEARERREAADELRRAAAAQRQAEHAVWERQYREQLRAQAAERAAAEATARELLMAHLDAQQKRDVLAHGWFEVLSDKGRRWRIRLDGYSGNVDLMPERGEERLASYCAHGRDEMPASDHHLAQKLVLETDDEDFLDVANVHYRQIGVGPELPVSRRRRAELQDPMRAYGVA